MSHCTKTLLSYQEGKEYVLSFLSFFCNCGISQVLSTCLGLRLYLISVCVFDTGKVLSSIRVVCQNRRLCIICEFERKYITLIELDAIGKVTLILRLKTDEGARKSSIAAFHDCTSVHLLGKIVSYQVWHVWRKNSVLTVQLAWF